jgi:flagellar M-ring protein FliF
MEAWRRMGLVQRVTLVSVLLACVGAAALLIGWAREPHMALLYSRLDPEDAAEVVAKIQEADTEYDLKDGGTSIYVPSEKVYALRLQLAGEGLPTGGQQGYRILDTEKIGTSPFTQRVNYVRALEGELARTITLIDGVEHARIHVVRTESRLFREDEAGTSATVAVRLRPGRRLSQGNVAAIVHMVAGAVDHLSPENVVVVDSQGTLLSTGAESHFAGGTGGTVLDYKSQVEEYLARKAEQMLTLVLGPGRATVKVSAEVETSTVNKTEETYSPDGAVPVKEEISSKSETPAATAQGGASGQSKEETTTTEYEVGRTVSQTINMPGKILSLSVAAFVDLSPPETATETPAEEGAEPAATPAPTLSTQDVEEVVRRAIGLTESDELKVVSTKFHHPPAIGEEAAENDFLSDPAFYLDVARHASLGILVVGALLALKMFGGSRRKTPAPLGTGEAETAVAGGESAVAGNLLPAGTGMPADAAQVNRRIAAALKENPDEVKRLFRTWVQQQGAA